MSSKSQEKAEVNKEALGGGQGKPGGGSARCAKEKHFFAIAVKDSDGKPVTDVKPRIELNDGSVIAPTLEGGKYNTGKVLESAGPCKVLFPSLYDIDWWESAKPTGVSATDKLPVADGDCAVSLALDAGFRNYHDVWDRADNAELKKNRSNPNSLTPADELFAPDEQTKDFSKAVDQEWPFVIEALKAPKLRVVLVDKDLKPLDGWKWTMTSPEAKSGTTTANGLIELPQVDPAAKSGNIKLTIKKPPPKPVASAVAGPAPDPPPYPAPIKPADFKDKEPAQTVDTHSFEFTFQIGSLPSHKDKKGTLSRLHNLGFACEHDSADKVVTRAVKNYQKTVLKQKDPSGVLADIQDDIETRHGKA